MNVFFDVDEVVAAEVIERLGWGLFHSLWQFAVVAFVGVIALRAMRWSSAEARSVLLTGLLVLVAACPVVTWLVHPAPAVSLGAVDDDEVLLEDDSTAAAEVRSDVANGDAALITANDAGEDRESVSVPAFGADDVVEPTEPLEPLATSTGEVPEPAVESPSRLSWARRTSNAARPWLTWAVSFWGIGVVLCSLRPVIGWLTLRRLKRVGVSPVSSELVSTLGRVSKRIGV
ncbi:MAG: hypothetical protein AB8G99_01945, partial [Planctomycetaceae bacterium]